MLQIKLEYYFFKGQVFYEKLRSNTRRKKEGEKLKVKFCRIEFLTDDLMPKLYQFMIV